MNSTVKEILPLLDYIKIGSYREQLGGLVSTTTNQKMFKVNNKQQLEDITNRFWKKGVR
jgi:anaerobic ribonucleoside-triphosphate reductase activating protein